MKEDYPSQKLLVVQDWGTLLQFDLQFYLSSGNVQAVLVRGNRPYILTKDHTPYNKNQPVLNNKVLLLLLKFSAQGNNGSL